MKIISFILAASLFSCNPVFAEEICFPLADGMKMLKDLEALESCRATVKAGEEAINSCEVRASALEDRVADQDKEIAKAKKTIEETRKAGEEAAKMASDPWYKKVLNAGKWIALGLVVGFVGGLAK